MMRMFIWQIMITSPFNYDETVVERFFNPDMQEIAAIIQLPKGRRVSLRGTIIDVSIIKIMAKLNNLLVQL